MKLRNIYDILHIIMIEQEQRTNPEPQSSKMLTRLAARIDRVIAKIPGGEPSLYQSGDGSTVEIFPRFGVPEASRWIKLPNGKMTVVRSTDIVHAFDGNGTLIERKRIQDAPTTIEVFAEGAPLSLIEP